MRSSYLAAVQKSCLPAVWARGLTLARANAVRLEKDTPTEIVLRVKLPERPVSAKVSLWPEDEDAFCDCADRVDPCVHVAASVAALRNGLASSGIEDSAPVIRYRLEAVGEALSVISEIGGEVFLTSLTERIGGLTSGRIAGPPIEATQTDFAVDEILRDAPRPPTRAIWQRLMPVLQSVAETQPGGLKLGELSVTIEKSIAEYSAKLVKDGKGLRLYAVEAPGLTRRFSNGVGLFGSILRAFTSSGLSTSDRDALLGEGRRFSPAEVPKLLTEIIPELEKRIPIEREDSVNLIASEEPPRIVFRMEPLDGVLHVVPTIEYSSPLCLRNREAEASLNRRLETEFRMGVGRRAQLRGSSALEFLKSIGPDTSLEKRGTGFTHFEVENELRPEFSTEGEGDFQARFGTPSGKQADPRLVLEAFLRGEEYVSLLEGGFAPLPMDWLREFAPRLERLFLLREHGGGRLPKYAEPVLLEISEAMGSELQPRLRELKQKLFGNHSITRCELPSDLKADLRPYQRDGVDWLRFLTDSGMGALLADDMGLGKTLQAICVIRGRTLVVAPKSVIFAWKEQIELFRPSLRVAIYGGNSRSFDADADVTLVTYGLLRRDSESFITENWDLAILDEAQTIKNPGSQVAQAAHRIRARARIALSGTPVENRLADLWSQFEFLNPGLLGRHAEFIREFSDPIAAGNSQATELFRRRIRPFILRRLKSEVALDLPLRTEVVLRNELSDEERALYTALLASTRREVVERLEAGASPLSILELLLRLRQACCHPSLVPGQSAETSTKVELLLENLEKSLALGHRALVFSQWTSFLDLIERRLSAANIRFSRLDGSTPNRSDIVRDFQRPDGASVLLLSLKAGGVGLTLTAADHVYLMDSWWNPAVEEQAADRAHRIGQESPVWICRLITEDTVEEKILALQKRKRALSDAVLTGDVATATIHAEDLLALLEPNT